MTKICPGWSGLSKNCFLQQRSIENSGVAKKLPWRRRSAQIRSKYEGFWRFICMTAWANVQPIPQEWQILFYLKQNNSAFAAKLGIDAVYLYGKTQAWFLQSILLLFSKCTFLQTQHVYFFKRILFKNHFRAVISGNFQLYQFPFKCVITSAVRAKKKKKKKVVHMSVDWMNTSSCQNHQMFVFIKFLNDQRFCNFSYSWLNAGAVGYILHLLSWAATVTENNSFWWCYCNVARVP